MRRTVITSFQAERNKEYNPDDHALLDRKGQLDAKIAVRRTGGEIRAFWDFTNDYASKETGEPWGSLHVKAETTITDASIVFTGDEQTPYVSKAMIPVLEGAFADEVLLPVSVMARAMRLPGLMRPPLQIFQADGPQASKAQGEDAEE